MEIRKLTKNDEAQAVSFLKSHVETSLFLLSDIELGGFDYQGRLYQAEFWASFNAQGEITNIVAHCWNNMVLLQTPEVETARALHTHFKQVTTRPVGGFMGLKAHVEQAIRETGLGDKPLSMDGNEVLYKVVLEKIIMPDFDASKARLNPVSELDRDIFHRWQVDYEVEALHRTPGSQLEKDIGDTLQDVINTGNRWFLDYDGEPVSMVGFNARIPEIVQIGPVWTPTDKRCNGFARIGLALALEQARDKDGVKTSILFAENPAAAKAYIAIGYKAIGDYKLAMFTNDHALN